jgi:tetratricopeptide (TPR) repeat protein
MLTTLNSTKRKLFVFILSCLTSVYAIGQTKSINVSMEDRNKAIEFNNEAFKLINDGKPKDSFPLIIKAIHTDSTLLRSYELLYRACLTSGVYDDAHLNYFFIAKRIFDIDDRICFFIAEMYKNRKEIQKAITEYTKAINFGKNDSIRSEYYYRYYSNRAYCYTLSNLNAQAIKDYNECLEFNPEDAILLLNRGVCYKKTGDTKHAIADWKESARLGLPVAKTYLQNVQKKKK